MIDFVVDLVEERVDLVVLNFMNQFSNAGTLRMLHNGMWYSWNSEVHVRFVHHYWLMIHVMINNKSHRSLTKCFISDVERFAFMSSTRLRTIWHSDHVMRDNGPHRSLMCLFNVEILSVFRWKCLDDTRFINGVSPKRVFPFALKNQVLREKN